MTAAAMSPTWIWPCASAIGAASKRVAAMPRSVAGCSDAAYPTMSKSSIGSPKERTEITVAADDLVNVIIGTQPSGQGHETSFAQVVSDLLGVPVANIDIITGDTDIVTAGGGSHSGRSLRHAATVMSKAATS